MKQLVIITALLMTQLVWANSRGENFAKALQAQLDGNIQKSIELYETIVKEGHWSSELYNNLGLAYVQKKKLGKAILNFERALKIDASNQEAQHNLQAAEQRINNPIKSYQPLFFVRWWNGLAGILSSTGWAVLFLLMMCAVAGGMGVWRWYGDLKYRKIAIGVLITSILPLIWGFQQKAVELDNSTAIIIKKEVGIRQEADLGASEIELVSEGTKIKVLRQEESWVYVQLPNLLVGWMPAQMMEKI